MVVYIFAGRFSRAEKRRLRSRVQLDDAALTDKTRTRYYLALRKLLPYFEASKSGDDLDTKICAWVRHMWSTGEPLLTVGDGLSALHYFQPWTKRRIPHSWKLFGVWRRIEIPSRAPPLTERLVKSMAAYEVSCGRLDMACMLLLGFSCLLRTGEFLCLTIHGFSLGHDTGICSLKNTKSGRREGVNEVASITDMETLETLRQLVILRRQMNLSPKLWDHSNSSFRQQFKHLCNKFGLDTFEFRPYSLRRGGATAYFQQTQSMEATLIRGRWQSSKVAKLYIADGLSFLPNIKLSDHTRKMLKRYNF